MHGSNESVCVSTYFAMFPLAKCVDGAAGLIAAGAIPHLSAALKRFGFLGIRLVLHLLGVLLVGEEAVCAA